MIAADMHVYFAQNNVPQNRRLTNLTLLMLGTGEQDSGLLHKGFIPKLKAAETGTLLGFVMDILVKKGTGLPRYEDLLAAGTSLVEYYDLMHQAPLVLPLPVYQSMADACQRHLLACERALIGFTPKHHLWMHLVHRCLLFS